MKNATFSEQWYRVADLRVGILPSVRVHKQIIRDKIHYILTDTYSQKYFQVSPEAYAFLARLSPRRSVDEIWRYIITEYPEQAPGQDEVAQVLSQLHHANLLYHQSLPDGGGIFDRERKKRRREFQGKLLTFLFIRIPLWNPNAWLNRVRPLARLIFSLPLGLIWLGMVLYAALAVLENSSELVRQSQGILAMGNLPLLYLCLAGLKICHEMAHSLACKRFGGDVHSLGVMFLVFMPLPYMDATSSWSFRERKQRVLVSSAGMIAELFLAAVAAVIWTITGEGLINSLAFNVMVVGSVSSLLFNGNPLLRFDAYYILSDLVDIPNLAQKATRQWNYLAQRYLMGSDAAVSASEGRRERLWLTGYGAASYLYRLFITFAIVLFVLDQFFAIGVVAAITTFFLMVVRPAWRLFEYLVSPHIHRHRSRAIIVTLLLLLSVASLVSLLPIPYRVKVPGVLEALDHSVITTPVAGRLNELRVQSGQQVMRDQVLLVMYNMDLETDIIITRQALIESGQLQRRALWDAPGESAALNLYTHMLEDRLADLLARKKSLVIQAPMDGIWVAPPLHEKLDNWFARGDHLGQLIDPTGFRFTAVVPQEKANELFREQSPDIGLRLHGQADTMVNLNAQALHLIPYQRERLVSAALGWAGGGAIAVRSDAQDGQQAAEGFYEVRVRLPDTDQLTFATLLHGASGELCVTLGSQPLLKQARRGIMQLLQKRYGLLL